MSRLPGRSVARWAGFLAGVIALAAAAWWVTNSSLFDVRSVRVSGNDHLSAQEVTTLASLEHGTNILWLSTAAVEARLESDAWVLAAAVSRSLPSTVTISIVERTPVAVSAGTHPRLVAGDGTILGPAARTIRLPALDVGVGPRRGAWPELTIARTLQRRLRPLVASIGRDHRGGLVLVLRGGVHVAYGDGTQAREKADALRAVLGWASRHGVAPQYVDVTAPSAPVLLPPGVPVPAPVDANDPRR